MFPCFGVAPLLFYHSRLPAPCPWFCPGRCYPLLRNASIMPPPLPCALWLPSSLPGAGIRLWPLFCTLSNSPAPLVPQTPSLRIRPPPGYLGDQDGVPVLLRLLLVPRAVLRRSLRPRCAPVWDRFFCPSPKFRGGGSWHHWRQGIFFYKKKGTSGMLAPQN